MFKVAIVGAGNVGGQIAMLLVKEALAEVLLLDQISGLAKAKALDLEDFSATLKQDCVIKGGDDFSLLKGVDIVVVAAGVTRKPGMTREDLLKINSEIIQDVSIKIKKFADNSVVIVVTNPVDLMTNLVSGAVGFKKTRVFGMGISLDSARFANLIHKELGVPLDSLEPLVIGSHGQAMLVLRRLSEVKGISLERLLDQEVLVRLTKDTIERGSSIVMHMGSGSAYFGPAGAAINIIRSILKDEKRIIGVCAFLSGEYGIKDLYLGVPARIGRAGVEDIIELDLNQKEKEQLLNSAEFIRKQLELAGIR